MIKVGEYIGVDGHLEPYKVKAINGNKVYTECGKELNIHHCYWVPVDYELPPKQDTTHKCELNRPSQKQPVSTRDLNDN